MKDFDRSALDPRAAEALADYSSIYGDGQRLLGSVRADHILVQHFLDFLGLFERSEVKITFSCFFFSHIFNNALTKLDTLVTDINSGTGDQ